MKEKNLTDEDRQRLGTFLLRNVVHGKVSQHFIDQAAFTFSISTRTVRRVWKETQRQVAAGEPLNLISKKKGKKGKEQLEFDEEFVSNIPFRLRGTQRAIAKQVMVSKSTVGRWIERGLIRAHTNAIKLALTEANMVHRLQYVLTKLNPFYNAEKEIQFKDLDNVVHIDEKWFNITKASHLYYFTTDECDPYRSCKSKRYITKVMFMCVVARPQFGPDGEELFDGKIGIFPFTYEEAAIRNSKNRVAGTIVTKPIESITKEVIHNCLINQVIPAIKARWPLGSSGQITIQQDNARPHISITDPKFISAANSDGFIIRLTCQPPNSPDLNVLDLGFFRAIQALQTETVSKSIEELVSTVQEAYDKLESVTLDKVFISLQACMVEIINVKGHNNYKVPHMGKNRLLRLGSLRRLLVVDEGLVKECLQYLSAYTAVPSLEALNQVLGLV